MNKSSRPDNARTWAAMTGWRRAVTAACSGLTLALGAPVAQAQVSVSSSGSPSYGQAIAVPPGIGGMQPNLSLMYAGGGVNGPVGHGWSVQGISMITRCPATRYTDGAPKGVVFASADKLCLDGQRLIQTDANGTPSAFPQIDDARGLASGWREYRTEKDSFARIRAYGTTGVADTNGPLYFKVWTKAGQIYEYGATPTADANTKAAVAAQGKPVIMVWAVARVSDVVGNYIDFKYEQRDVAWGSGPTVGSPTLGREWNIAEIQYTGNSSNAQVPANKVIFRYSDRTLDKAEAYQQGSKNVSVRRLDGIDSYVNSPNNTALGAAVGAVKVRTTNLAYDNTGVTKRSRLASITECTGAATPVCQPPVRFTYANGGNEAFTASTTFNLATTALMNNTGTMGVIPIDFDSDGKTDLLRWSDTPAQNQLWKSNGDGTFTTVPAFNITTEKLFSSDGCYESILMDYNGDGLVDILRVVKSGCANRTHILYLSSGNGAYVAQTMPAAIALDKTKITYQQPSCSALPGRVWSRTEGRYYYVADVNGDGIPDITTSIAPAWTWTCDEPPDFSTLCATLVCTRVFLGSTTGAFTEVTPSNVSNRSLYRDPALDKDVKWRNAEFDVADADGDGIADLNSSESGTWLSRPGPGGALSFDPLSGGSNLNCRRAIDANGDGRADCLNLSATVTSNALLTSTGYAAFNASAFNLNTTGNELLGTGVGTVVLDFNGDGRTDILRWKDDPDAEQVVPEQWGRQLHALGELQPRGRHDSAQQERRHIQLHVGRLPGQWHHADPAPEECADRRRGHGQPTLCQVRPYATRPTTQRGLSHRPDDHAYLRLAGQWAGRSIHQRPWRGRSGRGLPASRSDNRQPRGHHQRDRGRRGRCQGQDRVCVPRLEGRRRRSRHARLQAERATEHRPQWRCAVHFY